MNLEAGWQTVIRIRRSKLGRANSKISMEPEVGEEGQRNAAGKHLLTVHLPGRNNTLLWKSGKSKSLA